MWYSDDGGANAAGRACITCARAGGVGASSNGSAEGRGANAVGWRGHEMRVSPLAARLEPKGVAG